MTLPWTPFLFLQAPDFIKSSLAPESIVDLMVPGSTQPLRLRAHALDVECLRLFPRGTAILCQVDKGWLMDWTLYPIRLGKKERLEGDEWKDG